MGCCPSSAVNDVSMSVISSDVAPEKTDQVDINEIKNFKIFISYCWSDTKIAHKLNEDLKNLKSILKINLDKQPINIESIIPDCDLFIACLSESYMNSSRCQREAFMATNFNIPIFILSVNEKFKLDKNKASIIFGKQIEKFSNKKIFSYCLSRNEIIKKIKYLRNHVIENRRRPYNKIFEQKKAYEPDNAHKYFSNVIERNWRLTTSIGKNNLWRDYVGFSGPDRTEKEMEERKRLDNDLSIKKKKRIKLSKYFNDRYKNCALDTFCVFAERMLKNNQEFEYFCKN